MTKREKEEFEETFAYMRSHFRNETDEDWESFKKWAVKDASGHLYAKFPWFVTEQWLKWNGIQENKERESIEKQFQYKGKKYLCAWCGEEKSEDQFHERFSNYVRGKRVSVRIYDGKGICEECYEADRAERKRISEEHKKELRKRWYQEHKEEIAAKQKATRPARREANQKYAKTHRDHINQHIAERKQNDPVYKLKCQARKTIYSSFTRAGYVKQEKCESIVGLKQEAFIEYLLKTYKKNYGKSWDGEEPVHVDHIIPLATANTEEDVIRLCHYTNLQLLTAKDNILKGDKLYANYQAGEHELLQQEHHYDH